MSRARRDRSTALAALVPRPAPRSARATATWATLDEAERARLRRAAVTPSLVAQLDDVDHAAVVHDLATQHAAHRPLDLVTPLVTGLLVLSTVWGFGRAVFPTEPQPWLVAGLVGAAATVWGARRRVRVRRAAAVRVLRLTDRGPPQ